MISIVICTYNRDKYLGTTLSMIASCKLPSGGYELVLVDNNCTDSTSEICREFASSHPEISFKYVLESNQGLSYARNRGISESAGDVIVFLDDDAFVSENYLQRLEVRLSEFPDAAAFGGRIRPLFENGAAPGWLCRWTRSWLSALDMGDEPKVFSKGYPIGANMGFRRSALELCGGFDTRLGRTGKNLMGGEEKDIFLRLMGKGFKVLYFPDVEVQHVIPESRTTREYIVRFAKGVGCSEYLRCKADGGLSLARRIISEGVKWGASLLLWLIYAFSGRKECGEMLLLFRKNVTSGLLFHKDLR